MTTRQQIDMIRNDWFKDHVALRETAVFPGGVEVTRVVWRKPGTVYYRIDYLLYGSVLFVCGDLGEAVYEWPEHISLTFLRKLDLDYFGSKCQASSQEPHGKTWDSDRVRRWIEEQLANWAEENPIVGNNDEEKPRPPLTFEKCCQLMADEEGVYLRETIGHPYTWASFIHASDGLILSDVPLPSKARNRTPKYPMLRGMWETSRVGYTWDLRTRAHLLGLQMAIEQLEKTDVPAAPVPIG